MNVYYHEPKCGSCLSRLGYFRRKPVNAEVVSHQIRKPLEKEDQGFAAWLSAASATFRIRWLLLITSRRVCLWFGRHIVVFCDFEGVVVPSDTSVPASVFEDETGTSGKRSSDSHCNSQGRGIPCFSSFPSEFRFPLCFGWYWEFHTPRMIDISPLAISAWSASSCVGKMSCCRRARMRPTSASSTRVDRYSDELMKVLVEEDEEDSDDDDTAEGSRLWSGLTSTVSVSLYSGEYPSTLGSISPTNFGTHPSLILIGPYFSPSGVFRWTKLASCSTRPCSPMRYRSITPLGLMLPSGFRTRNKDKSDMKGMRMGDRPIARKPPVTRTVARVEERP